MQTRTSCAHSGKESKLGAKFIWMNVLHEKDTICEISNIEWICDSAPGQYFESFCFTFYTETGVRSDPDDE
jgi:hypothetical protein